MSNVSIHLLEHGTPNVAAQIHAVQMAAYAQEAALLGVTRFPPLDRTIDDVQQSGERFYGAFDPSGTLVGALGSEPADGTDVIHIASLVVAPSHQRKGIGRMLLEAALSAFGRCDVTVSTGAANTPALALYAAFEFREERRRVVGEDPIEIVELRRTCDRSTMQVG